MKTPFSSLKWGAHAPSRVVFGALAEHFHQLTWTSAETCTQRPDNFRSVRQSLPLPGGERKHCLVQGFNASRKLWGILSQCAVLIVLAAACQFTCHAGISEPDNIIYGTIFLGTNALTARNTNVFVEARQTTNGPAIASYQMGSLPTAGNYYSLRVSLEDSPPVNPVASQTGNTLYVTVRDQTGVRTQQVYTVADRGHVTRMDFGNALPDSDGDGLPDAWELLYFGGLGMGANFVAANGQTALANYIAGTNPNNTNSVLEVNIQLNPSHQRIVSFYGIAAAGTGYTGLSRIYDLQYTTNFASAWLDIPGMNNVTGNNQTVNYLETGTNAAAFYRVKVRLQ